MVPEMACDNFTQENVIVASHFRISPMSIEQWPNDYFYDVLECVLVEKEIEAQRGDLIK